MPNFSDFPMKESQERQMRQMKTLTVATIYGNCAPPAVNHNRLGFPEQPLKGTQMVPPLLEPAFTPSREAHWILRKGNSEESSASKKSNFYCPRFARKNALF